MFTFSESVNNLYLSAYDITVGGKASKDTATLTGTGTTRTLSPITVNGAGLATVSINKTGIEAAQQSVIVYKAGESVPDFWTITWNLNGGAEGASYPTLIENDLTLAKPTLDPVKANNIFDGWYADPALTQEYDFASPVTGDLTLYAKWEEGNTVPGATLVQKLSWVKNANNVQDGQTYNIIVTADEAISPQTLSYTNRNNITINLLGSGDERIVSLSTSIGSLFIVESGVTLVLDSNVTLSGRNGNEEPLVKINSGGALVMNTGAEIINNINRYIGGGVYVAGTFTMDGGKISGNGSNSSNRGGGVHVLGTFTMNDGEISGNINTASNASGGGVYVDTNGTFTMNNGEISGNSVSTAGGGVYVRGTFTMNDGEISGNTASYFGPEVYVGGASATFTMKGGKISDNYTDGIADSNNRGGVYVGGGGTFTMENGEISGNRRGVSVDGGTFIMSDGKIFGNSVNGVYMEGGAFTMNNGEISGGVYVGNHSGTNNYSAFTMNGGKISGNRVYVDVTGTFTMNNGEISGNTVSSEGGGVYLNSGTFTMSGGKITGNTAATSGGGVFMRDASGTTSRSSFTMNGGEISDNTASTQGGGVFAQDGTTFTMNDGKISGNTASSEGGGVIGTFTMNGGEISGNTATNGGGVCGRPFMNGGTISGNTATNGGGVYVYGYEPFTMNGGKISGNTSTSGGAIYLESTINSHTTFTMKGGEIFSNTSSDEGGGVYMMDEVIFHMVTGTIYGVDADADLKNTASTEAALYYKEGSATAEYGTFNASTGAWISKGSLSATENTIIGIDTPIWVIGRTVSLTAPPVYLNKGNAQGWQISDSGTDGWTDFTPPTTTVADASLNGKYLRYYANSSSSQTHYSNVVSLSVVPEREVTIFMRGQTDSSWFGKALRINVNGTDLAENAKLVNSQSDYYQFGVGPRDVVQIYWVNSSNYDDYGCAFAVYYSDDPPNPMFDPNSSGTVSSKVLVFKRYAARYSDPVGSKLMGSFTVP